MVRGECQTARTAEPQFFEDCDTPEAYRDLVSLFEQRQPTARSV
jgi:hypothetical protein